MKSPHNFLAIAGMVLTAISVIFALHSFVLSYTEIFHYDSVSRSFVFWIYSVVVSGAGLFVYIIYGILSLRKAIHAVNRRFWIILAAALFTAVPLWIWLACGSSLVAYAIWNVYLIALAFLEALSLRMERQYGE